MKIMHVCMANFYIDGYTYQENLLPKFNKLDGHDVVIVASCQSFVDNMTIDYIEPGTYINNDGIRVIRLEYDNICNKFISGKIRKSSKFAKILDQERPDVILFHGIQSWELGTVARYKKINTSVKLYVDSHADYTNSGTNFLSLNVLHKCFYKWIINKYMKYIDKVFYVALSARVFLKGVYGISDEKMELFSLGGIVLDNEEYDVIREKIRVKYGISHNEILFVQAGKIDKNKRLEDTIEAFCSTSNTNFRLIIAGSISDDVYQNVKDYITSDNRVRYIGWIGGNDLQDLLVACDVYVQPGTCSATAQNAICLNCCVVLNNHINYSILVEGNGWLVNTKKDLFDIFQNFRVSNLNEVKYNSERIASKFLDYKMLASRLYR